ncbi:carbohydrate ABC transporter permease [Streptomyces sp. NPDC058576]|uniref:carbohydrate ABC transporter permease n=1 Tax=Streptomyces sp. NPDC058576 TaxID=3346547 RepID=UPI00365368AB
MSTTTTRPPGGSAPPPVERSTPSTVLDRFRRRPSTRPVWMEKPTPAGSALKGSVLTAVVVLVVFPFVVVIATSLAGQAELTRNGGFVLWPEDPTLDAYRAVLSGGVVSRAVLVSAGVTLLGTAISLTATVLAAYGLSRKGSTLQRPLLLIVLLTFLFTPGIIPSYLVVKQLGMLDSYAALILPTAISAFNVVIVRGFFQSIPQELMDSARIDGAGEWRILGVIVLPLSKAVIAVVGLFYAVGYWNNFFSGLLYLSDSSKWPLQLVLRTYVLQGSPLAGLDGSGAEALPPQQSVQMAVLVIALVPILCVYPFLQRHFTKGVLTGAVKG